MNEVLLTKSGLEKLKEELRQLKEEKRPEIVQRIKTSKEYGDISENAEYESARNEQAFVEGKIQELEEMVKHAKIIEEIETDGQVTVGSKVLVSFNGSSETYEIVGAAESDPIFGKISVESPLGREILGKRKGDSVKVTAPDKNLEYKILKVE